MSDPSRGIAERGDEHRRTPAADYARERPRTQETAVPFRSCSRRIASGRRCRTDTRASRRRGHVTDGNDRAVVVDAAAAGAGIGSRAARNPGLPRQTTNVLLLMTVVAIRHEGAILDAPACRVALHPVSVCCRRSTKPGLVARHGLRTVTLLGTAGRLLPRGERPTHRGGCDQPWEDEPADPPGQHLAMRGSHYYRARPRTRVRLLTALPAASARPRRWHRSRDACAFVRPRTWQRRRPPPRTRCCPTAANEVSTDAICSSFGAAEGRHQSNRAFLARKQDPHGRCRVRSERVARVDERRRDLLLAAAIRLVTADADVLVDVRAGGEPLLLRRGERRGVVHRCRLPGPFEPREQAFGERAGVTGRAGQSGQLDRLARQRHGFRGRRTATSSPAAAAAAATARQSQIESLQQRHPVVGGGAAFVAFATIC